MSLTPPETIQRLVTAHFSGRGMGPPAPGTKAKHGPIPASSASLPVPVRMRPMAAMSTQAVPAPSLRELPAPGPLESTTHPAESPDHPLRKYWYFCSALIDTFAPNE